MKLYKEEHNLIFRYYNIAEESSVNMNSYYNNINQKNIHNIIAKSYCSPKKNPNQENKLFDRECYFTLDEIEKSNIKIMFTLKIYNKSQIRLQNKTFFS